MYAVICGIQSSSLSSSKKSNKDLKKYTQMFNLKSKSTNYRQEIATCGVPCVALARIIESDILENFSEQIVHTNLINFERCRHIGSIVMSVRNLQMGYSNLKQIKPLQQWIIQKFATKPKHPTNELTSSSEKKGIGFLPFIEPQLDFSLGFSATTNTQNLAFEDMV
jgi:hypothetical protein